MNMLMKRMLWIAALVALTAVAGCGGKDSMDTPPTEPTDSGSSAPQVEEATDQTPTNDSNDLNPMGLNDVFFDFDSYSLSSEAKGTLEGNAQEMKRVTAGTVSIEGHCDERGTQAYNLALGEKRANAAKDYLVSMGINASRISTVSYGKERPFDNGSDESAWAKNRRAHFVLGQ